jgi:two-component system, cell cycle response regulator
MPNNIFLGEFKNRQLEAEFLKHENAAAIKYIRPAVLLLGVLFFLFVIPDYHLTESAQTYQLILFVRSTFLALVIILYLQLKFKPAHHNKLHWVSAYELLVALSFLLIYYNYEMPNIFIQSFGAVILVLIFFHLGNRWLHALLVSLFLGFSFIMITLARPEELATMEVAAISVYMALFTALGSISSYRINIYKRMQFINNRELQRLSETDALTGIYTRGKFDQELNYWLDVASRYESILSIILFDIDDLKKINDTLGHLEGDRVLTTIVSLVRGMLRKTDIFARWGGDEFAILLPNTGKRQAYELAKRIKKHIKGHHFESAGPLSCSFGVEELRKGDTSSSLLSRVDMRLYQAKTRGKNLVK